MLYAKTTGPNVYIRVITINELDAIRDAVSDWRADGTQTPEKQARQNVLEWVERMQWVHKETELYSHLDENGERDFKLAEDSPDMSYWHEGIFLNSDDTCVGIVNGKFLDRVYYHYVTAIRPAWRGTGIYEEADALGSKTLFLTIPNLKHMVVRIPVGKENTSGTVMSQEDLGNTDGTIELADRIDPVTYHNRIITKEDFIAWYNLPEQETLRNTYYKYEIIEGDLF